MMNPRAAILFIFVFTFSFAKSQNLTIYQSELNVEETTNMLVKIIQENDLIFFETVSHDEIASARGLKINPTRSILFEDADLTTRLIECQPTCALDLPLEILVWEEHGDIYIGYIDPKFMVKRFMINGCDDTIELLSRLMLKVVMDTLRQM